MSMTRAAMTVLTVSIAVSSLTGCDRKREKAIAEMEHQPIFFSNLPVSDQLKLYDQSLQSHYMQLSSLRQLIETQSPDRPTKIYLTPPSPPELSINQEPSWETSDKSAAVQIQLACTYQSTPCARIIASINSLEPLLKLESENQSSDKSVFNLQFFDFSLPFHRFAFQALHSIECLETPEQKAIYRDFLWKKQGQISQHEFISGLILQGFSYSQAEACINPEKSVFTAHYDQYQKQLTMLEDAGVRHAPTMTINGKYIGKGMWESEIYRALSPYLSPETSDEPLPLKLLGIWETESSDMNWAQIKNSHFVTRIVRNSVVAQKTWVHAIADNKVTVFKNGKLYELPLLESNGLTKIHEENTQPTSDFVTKLYNQGELQENQYEISPTDPSNEAKEDSEAKQPIETEALDYQQRYEQRVSELTRINLSSEWLQTQIQRKEELEQQFLPTDHKIEGSSLLKLDRHEIDSFYTALGMEPGDVVVRVNNEWVYEGNNPLWQTLEESGELTISVIRKGIPVHLGFVVSSDF